MIVGIGHDIQLVAELEARPELLGAGIFFTSAELEEISRRVRPIEAMATVFSAKESFFKALPGQSGWNWPDIELSRSEEGRPVLGYHGRLAELMHTRRWSAMLSVSHSGPYVTTFVLIQE